MSDDGASRIRVAIEMGYEHLMTAKVRDQAASRQTHFPQELESLRLLCQFTGCSVAIHTCK